MHKPTIDLIVLLIDDDIKFHNEASKDFSKSRISDIVMHVAAIASLTQLKHKLLQLQDKL